MGYNKIPLALRYSDTTNNAEGLIEFQLNLSDVGDVCDSDTSPNPGDVLTYDTANRCWKASATPAVAAGALSALTDICAGVTSVTQYQALVWNGTEWCPSTIPTGGGGGGITSISDAGDVTITEPVADRELLAYDDATSDWINQTTTELGIMQLDPYFGVNDDGKTAVWDGSQLTVEYPDRLFIRVEAAETLVAGDVVYVVGEGPNDNTVRVAKAQANSSTTMPAIGMVFDGIDPNQVGTVVSFGKSSPVSVGTVAVGTTVYVDPTTAGGFTTTKPNGSTDLIQNIGFVAASGPNGIVKLTGVGRSNDIPINVDVVGSATIGTNEFTQTTAKLAGTTANEIVITDPTTNLINSVTSATLLSNYYTRSEADGQFLEETTNLTGIADVTGTPVANYILQRNSGNSNWDPVTMNAALLATGERVEDHNIEDLANVTSDTTFIDGHVLVYQVGGEGSRFTPFASSIFVGADATDHGSLIGLGDDDHTQYVLSAGTRSMSALTVNNEITTKDIEVTRLGQGRPTNFNWTSDYLTPQVFANGWNQGLGSGGSIGADSIMLNEYQDVAGIVSLSVNSNSSARIAMYSNNDTLYASGQAWSFATRACMQSASVAGATYSGVIGVANSATDYNVPGYGVYFLCGHGGGNWIARTSGQFGNTETDTGVALSSYTLSVLQIMCNEDWTKAEFYIDGNKVATHTTNLPNRIDNTGFLYKVWNNGAATAGGKMYVDWHDIKIISTSADRGEGHIKDFSDFTP